MTYVHTSTYVQGPHPRFPKRKVFHWFEMCDAVQDERYAIDGIAVSNFVLPLYFTSSTEQLKKSPLPTAQTGAWP